MTPNPEFKPVDDKKEGGLDSRAAQYICPVIGLEMSGKHRFIGLWSCGCVFSERASKEIDTNVCHKVINICISLYINLFEYYKLIVSGTIHKRQCSYSQWH